LLEEHKNLNHIKIIDFGEAILVEPTTRLTEIAGTMAYMVRSLKMPTQQRQIHPVELTFPSAVSTGYAKAPEVLGQSYGSKADIWSCGVIAYIILSGKQPLKGATDQETFTNIAKGEISYADPIWESISPEAQDFVKLLLTWDERLRPTASEALNHPWMMKNGQNKCELLRQNTMEALSNLESFDAKSKLRVATCTFIASQLMDKEEKEKIDDVFRAIDLNNDGTLNRQEVKQGYNTYFGRELTDEEIDSIFKVKCLSCNMIGS
jgi:serine/threonine protein kinase